MHLESLAARRGARPIAASTTPRPASPRMPVRPPDLSHSFTIKPGGGELADMAFRRDFASFAAHLTPQRLAQSPMADDLLTLRRGRDRAGRPLRPEPRPDGGPPQPLQCRLGELLAAVQPSVTPNFCAGYAILGVEGRYSPECLAAMPPLEPWNRYVFNARPPAVPLALLNGPTTANHRAAINSFFILSANETVGAPFHQHDPTLFMQIFGDTTWLLCDAADLWPLLEPGVDWRPGVERAPFAYCAQELLREPPWDAEVVEPPLYRFTTRPGDMLYIAKDALHATKKSNGYTLALSMIVDRPDAKQFAYGVTPP